MHKEPGDCGSLADELPDTRNKGGGAPQIEREARSANMALLRGFLEAKPDSTSKELSQKFAAIKIKLGDSAIRKYRKELGL